MDLTPRTWRKSSYRGSSGDNRVEVAAARSVAVRDSKDPAGPQLAVTADGWRAFTRRVQCNAR